MKSKKVTSIEEFNRENIMLKNQLNIIHHMCISVGYLLLMKGDLNMSKKVEHIGVLALRALKEDNVGFGTKKNKSS